MYRPREFQQMAFAVPIFSEGFAILVSQQPTYGIHYIRIFMYTHMYICMYIHMIGHHSLIIFVPISVTSPYFFLFCFTGKTKVLVSDFGRVKTKKLSHIRGFEYIECLQKILVAFGQWSSKKNWF